MQHRQWSPAEAAEFAAARLAHTLRMLADDPKARLGMHRAAGIARTQGYGEVSVSGLKFSELLTTQKNPAVQVEPLQREQHQAQEHDGVEYDQSHIEGEHAQSKQRSRKPRKRSAARKAKEHEKLEAKWHARRESERQGAEPQPALQEAPRPPPPPSVHSFIATAIDAKSAAEHDRLREAVRVEIIRVANAARVDVSTVMGECLAVRAECIAEANRGRPVSRDEVHRQTLERLAAFEIELSTASAPETHMVTEWGPQVQGQVHPGPEGASQRSP